MPVFDLLFNNITVTLDVVILDHKALNYDRYGIGPLGAYRPCNNIDIEKRLLEDCHRDLCVFVVQSIEMYEVNIQLLDGPYGASRGRFPVHIAQWQLRLQC